MTALASSLVDWGALWKIVAAALIGGTGVVFVFGLLLLGLEHVQEDKGPASTSARSSPPWPGCSSSG